jgi:hypothetical protein
VTSRSVEHGLWGGVDVSRAFSACVRGEGKRRGDDTVGFWCRLSREWMILNAEIVVILTVRGPDCSRSLIEILLSAVPVAVEAVYSCSLQSFI